MIGQSVIDRSGMTGTPPAITLKDDRSTTYTLMRGGLILPMRLPVVDYAPASKYLSGRTSLGHRIEHSSLGLIVKIKAATDTALEVAADELEAAIHQDEYQVTTTVGTAPPKTWKCDPGGMVPISESIDVMDVLRHQRTYRLSIPAYPFAVEA